MTTTTLPAYKRRGACNDHARRVHRIWAAARRRGADVPAFEDFYAAYNVMVSTPCTHCGRACVETTGGRWTHLVGDTTRLKCLDRNYFWATPHPAVYGERRIREAHERIVRMLP